MLTIRIREKDWRRNFLMKMMTVSTFIVVMKTAPTGAKMMYTICEGLEIILSDSGKTTEACKKNS